MNITKTTIAVSAALLISTTLSTPAFADAATSSGSDLKQALIDNATPSIDIRYRYEGVDQDGIANDAKASTVRTKLGYKSGAFHDVTAIVEIENVTYVGNDDFNSTTNGNAAYPVVADPDSTEINHAYLVFTGVEDTVIAVGRQPHNINNQRFVGTVGWRQNDQSFDSVAIINSSLEDTKLIYSYVDNVNRIFSDDHPFGNLGTETHVLNAAYSGLEFGTLTAYGLFIDLEDAALSGLSSKTFGLRFDGSTDVSDDVKALYEAEYARQSDHGDNATSYNADYYHLVAGISTHGVTAKLGYEVLGSDNGGTVSFQTPLGTLHKFNGWADKFLATPAAGLEDVYVSVGYKVSGVNDNVDGTKFTVVYHDFSAESGGADYGNELDASISQNFDGNYSVALKYANYDADTFATDTTKFWIQLGAKF